MEETDPIQINWGAYLEDIIAKLSPEKRAVIEASKPAFIAWRDGILADGMAQLRGIIEQVEDSMLEGVGVKRKRYAKRRQPKVGQLKLELTALPDFIQNGAGEFAQNGKPDSYNAETDAARNGASLLTPDTDSVEESVGRSGSPAPVHDRPTDPPPPAPQTEPPPNPIKEISAMLLATWAAIIPGETPSLKLCEQIHHALGGAPLAMLRQQMVEKRTRAKSMGFALRLAEDVGAAWRGQSGARAAAERATDKTRARDERARPPTEDEKAAERVRAQEILSRPPIDAPRHKPHELSSEFERRLRQYRLIEKVRDEKEREWAREVLGQSTKTAGGGT